MLRLIGFALAVAATILLVSALNLFDDWQREENPVRFVITAVAAGAAYLCAAASFPRLQRQAALLWSVALLLRIVALPIEPGDDLRRYRWEGKIQHAGFNPYIHAPDDPRLVDFRGEFPDWSRMNHRTTRTVYPPGAQLVFAGLSRMSDSALLYKLLFAAADLGTVAVLLSLIGGDDRYRRAVWYAWNPLVVYSFAGGAHFDSLMILPMLGGILLLTKVESATASRDKWLLGATAAALFGIAVSLKLIPLLLLPACVVALRSRAAVLAISLAIPALLAVLYGYPAVNVWEPFRRFADVTRTNDLFWWVIEESVWPNPRQRNFQYNYVIVIAVVLAALVFIRNWRRAMLWALGIVLVLSPALHPWYCTWILPLATWRRAYAWHVLSVSMFVYFLFWNERLFGLPWHAEPWMRALMIAPPLMALALLSRRRFAAPC